MKPIELGIVSTGRVGARWLARSDCAPTAGDQTDGVPGKNLNESRCPVRCEDISV